MIACEPRSLSPVPAGSRVCQLIPSRDDHTITRRLPGRPTVPAASNPRPAAVRAVTVASPPGALSGVCCQLLPPSVEYAANAAVPATVPAAVVSFPVATITRPRAATCPSTAALAPAGGGSVVRAHCLPSAEVQTAGA